MEEQKIAPQYCEYDPNIVCWDLHSASKEHEQKKNCTILVYYVHVSKVFT